MGEEKTGVKSSSEMRRRVCQDRGTGACGAHCACVLWATGEVVGCRRRAEGGTGRETPSSVWKAGEMRHSLPPVRVTRRAISQQVRTPCLDLPARPPPCGPEPRDTPCVPLEE